MELALDDPNYVVKVFEMTPLPAEHASGSAGGLSKLTLLAPFLKKTYKLVDDSSMDNLISWNEDGTSFIVWKPEEFSRDLIPKHFKHKNFGNFIRQLNNYGFRKIDPDRWEFFNPFFKKGEVGLLQHIQRRRSSPAVPIAASVNGQTEQPPAASNESNPTPTAAADSIPELVQENKRLRRENAQLRTELNRLQGVCRNVHSLASTFASDGLADDGLADDGLFDGLDRRVLDVTPLSAIWVDSGSGEDVMPELPPRMFGVPIGRVKQ